MRRHQLLRTADYQRHFVSVRHGIPTIIQTGSILNGLTVRSSYAVEKQVSFNGLCLPHTPDKGPKVSFHLLLHKWYYVQSILESHSFPFSQCAFNHPCLGYKNTIACTTCGRETSRPLQLIGKSIMCVEWDSATGTSIRQKLLSLYLGNQGKIELYDEWL